VLKKLFRNPLFVIFLVLLIDQVIKVYVKTTMRIEESYPIFGSFMSTKARILFTENPGMAFGWTFAGEYGKLFLSLFRILAVTGIAWYLRDLIKKKAPRGFIISIALIFAGAMGNIIDSAFYGLLFSESTHTEVAEFLPADGGYERFLHGRVVDMFHFPLIHGTFPDWFPIWGGDSFVFFNPIFNFADAAITCGVLSILIFQKRFFPKKPEPVTVEGDTSATDTASASTDDPVIKEGPAETQQ
jgi:signal peptidase II